MNKEKVKTILTIVKYVVTAILGFLAGDGQVINTLIG